MLLVHVHIYHSFLPIHDVNPFLFPSLPMVILLAFALNVLSVMNLPAKLRNG